MSKAPKHMNRNADPDASPEPALAMSPVQRVVGILLSVLASLVVSLGVCWMVGFLRGGFSTGSWFNRYWFVFFAASLFLVAVLYLNRDWFASKPENVYLVVVLTVSLLFSWTISVRTVGWDIGVHVRNIIACADLWGDVDHSVADVSVIGVSHMVSREEGMLQTLDATEEALDANATVHAETVERPGSPLWYVTGIEYIPYALALRLCRTLGLGYSRTLVLVRMVGSIFYSLVTYAGIRKLRTGKMLYASVALAPSSVFLAAEFGYSYWLLSLCMYGFASLAGMIQGSVEVRASSLLKMLAALFLGMLPRVVYFPLMFLCLLIPSDKFERPNLAKLYRGLLVGAAFVALGTWLVPKLVAGYGAGDARGGQAVDPNSQISYIVAHPGEYAHTFLRLILPPFAMQGGGPDVEGVNPVSGLLSIEALPGLLTNYGYLPRVNPLYTVLVVIALVFTSLTDKDSSKKVGWVPGIVALLLSSGIMAMIITIMYIDFTPVGLSEIHGVQRRYLLPMLYPLLMFAGPHALGLTGSRPRVSRGLYNSCVLCGMLVVLMASWWASGVSVIT